MLRRQRQWAPLLNHVGLGTAARRRWPSPCPWDGGGGRATAAAAISAPPRPCRPWDGRETALALPTPTWTPSPTWCRSTQEDSRQGSRAAGGVSGKHQKNIDGLLYLFLPSFARPLKKKTRLSAGTRSHSYLESSELTKAVEHAQARPARSPHWPGRSSSPFFLPTLPP